MEFTSLSFLFLFMPISIIGYLIVNRLNVIKANNIYLLIISIVLYAWTSMEFLGIFLAFIFMVYLFGNMIHNSDSDLREKKKWVALSLCILAGILAYYKYYGFVMENLNLSGYFNIEFRTIVIPIGISFIIFEAISYLVDIYRRDADTGSLLDTALFFLLFPKLVSGPIVLWKDFRPQTKDRRTNLTAITQGIDRIIAGYAKKAVIADSLGAVVAQISAAAPGIDRGTYLIRAFLYMIEIYFDFSGYSDIAIGLCGIFGFRLKENFNYPYTAVSITEFWRRWHISLGTWFREYVYIPLGGNRRGNVYWNLFLVFLLTGIWHGSGWTFLLWGAIYGLFIVLERAVSGTGWYERIPAFLKWCVTMSLVFLMWILFLSSDIADAAKTYVRIFGKPMKGTVNFSYRYYLTVKTCCTAAVGALLSVAGAGGRISSLVKRRGGDFGSGIALAL